MPSPEQFVTLTNPTNIEMRMIELLQFQYKRSEGDIHEITVFLDTKPKPQKLSAPTVSPTKNEQTPDIPTEKLSG